MPKWTDEDLNFLKENYQDMEAEQIGEKLNRSKEAVHWKAHHIGLSKMPEWTDDELKIIKNNYKEKGPSWCAKNLDRTVLAIKYKAQEMGIQVENPDKSGSGRKISKTLTQPQIAEIARIYCGSLLYNAQVDLSFLSEQERELIENAIRKQAYIILNGRKTFDSIEKIIDWVIN